MHNGIYGYRDLKTNEIVYIGKDSHIDKHRRHKDHTEKWSYDQQQINRVIQNNPSRYEYTVFKKGNFSTRLLNALEILYIRRYSPKFNFTIGGDSYNGKAHPSFKNYARVISDGESIFTLAYEGKKICSNKSKKFLNELAKKINNDLIDVEKAKELNKNDYKKRCSQLKKNKPFTKQHKVNLSKSRNKTGFFRVSKTGDRYKYNYLKNGKKTGFSAYTLEKLKQKVIENNLEWFIIDSQKAKKTMEG